MNEARHVRRPDRQPRGGAHLRARARKPLRALLAMTMAGAGLAVFQGAERAGAATGDGTVTVTVVRAIDADGTPDTAAPVVEPGLAGVTVRLSDPAGHVLSGQTGADGIATFDPDGSALVGGRYRVEVVNPKPGILHPAFAAEDGAPSVDRLSSTVEFVDVTGDRPASVTTGFWNPDDYTQDDPRIISAHQVDTTINTLDTRSIYTDSYTVDRQLGQTAETNQSQTGTVYGIGWNRALKLAYAGAYAKRGAPYGPAGPGGIYYTDPVSGATGTFAVVPDAGTTVHRHGLFAPDNHDVGFVGVPGKESLGDVEVSEDDEQLYAVNMGDRKVYVYDIAADGRSGSLATTLVPPASACSVASDWRPGALATRDGKVFVGGVCSGEAGGRAALRSIVWEYDAADLGAAPVKVLDQAMDYERGSNAPYPCPAPFGAGSGKWYAWTDTTPACATDLNSFYPMPVLLDIDFEISGEMVLSYRDRWGDQYGHTTLSTQLDRFVQPAAMGELLRACRTASGDFVFDEWGGCGTVGPDGEYYQDASPWVATHPDAAFSGIAIAYNQATLVANTIDITTTFQIYTANMSRTGSGGALGPIPSGWTNHELQANGGFLKGNGLADIEVMAEQAPIQIGNRLWYDADADGVQSADEAGVPAGVTVRLHHASGGVVAETTTNARGEYYFDSLEDGVAFGADYTVRFDEPADFAAGGPLDAAAWTLAPRNAGSGPFADELDSDAVLVGGFPRIPVTTGGAGADDHSYDAGLVPSAPRIDIVTVDGRAEVPADPVDGADPIGGGQTDTSANWPPSVDADTPADAVRYPVQDGTTGEQQVRFVVTNNGNVPLGDLEVTDETIDGTPLDDVQCDFPMPGQPGSENGTTWAGPLAPGQSIDCVATVTLPAGGTHGDIARVTAVPVDADGSPRPGAEQVGDEDRFHAVADDPAPVLDPAIDIVDVDGRAPVPANPVDGADPIGGPAPTTADNWAAGVDADTAPDAVVYAVGPDGGTGAQPVRFVVTNTGTAPLGDVAVSVENLSGPALDGVACDFPDVAGAQNGLTWDGPFAVGTSFECVGTVTLQAGEQHANRAQVTGVELDGLGEAVPDPRTVGDEDRFHARAEDPEPVRTPAIDIVDVDGRAEVPQNPVDGADPVGDGATETPLHWSAGTDADTADNAVTYPVVSGDTTGPQPVRFVVTNTGTSPLGEVRVSQETISGTPLEDLECAFPMPAEGDATSWPGPFAVGASFECVGTVTLRAGEQHANRAQVTAVELDDEGLPVPDGRTVDDEDRFHARAEVPAPVLDPAIDIVDADGRVPVPATPVDGADPIGGGAEQTDEQWPASADADDEATAVRYEVNEAGTSGPQPVRFVVTNTGTAPLGDIEVGFDTVRGPALSDVQCDFPMPGNPGVENGTTWSGPFAVGASFECVGTVVLRAGQQHANRAQVTGVELDAEGRPLADPRRVGDEDRYHARSVQPELRITKRDDVSDDEADSRADAIVFAPGEDRILEMPVRNTGEVPLTSVRVLDRTTDGPAMTDFACRFPGEEDWTEAVDGVVRWAASFPGGTATWSPGASFLCRGELTMEAGDPDHASIVRVIGLTPGGAEVSAENPFNAEVGTMPGIDIVEYDGRAQAPTDRVDGPDPVDGLFAGPTTGDWPAAIDADTAPDAVRYAVDGSGRTGDQPVRMVITNTGTAVIGEVKVRTRTHEGPGLRAVTCDFSEAQAGAPTSGTRWSGRFLPGTAFTCVGTLALSAGAMHNNTASVTGTATTPVAAGDSRSVGDEDQYRATASSVEAGPAAPPVAMPDTGGPQLGLALAGLALVLGGALLVRRRVQFARHRA